MSSSSEVVHPDAIATRDGVRGDGVRGDGVRGDGVRGDGMSGDGMSGDGMSGDGVSLEVEAAGTPPELAREAITEPAKVMRIGSMVKMLLDEVRAAPLDEASRERLAEIYERSVTELSMALSPDLQEELHMLAL